MNHQLAATPVPANGIANTERVSGHDFSKYFHPFFLFFPVMLDMTPSLVGTCNVCFTG
jgi:hypothetical protein